MPAASPPALAPAPPDHLPTLPAALAGSACARPAEPFLFYRSGWDWRWIDHRWAAAAVATLAGQLTSSLTGETSGRRVAFDGGCGVDALLVDLAIQAAGFCPDPRSPARPTDEPAEGTTTPPEPTAPVAWADLAGSPETPAGLRRIALELPARSLWAEPPQRRFGGAGTPPRPRGDLGPFLALAAGVAAREPDGPVRRRLERAARLAARIGRPRRRDVVVSGHPLAQPLGAIVSAWALLTGAAIVVEPEPAARPATVVWARPTVVAGEPAELAGIAAASGRARRWRTRLRVVVTPDPAELAAGDLAGLRRRGVEVVGLPAATPTRAAPRP